MKNILKEIWSGFLRTIGSLAATALGTTLLLLIPSVRSWATHLVSDPASAGRTALTIFLSLSTLALLGLWIASEIRFFRLRDRIRKADLTLDDMASPATLMKALDRLDDIGMPPEITEKPRRKRKSNDA